MKLSENLLNFEEDFIFEDEMNFIKRDKVIYDVLAHLYRGIDWMEIDIDQMGGTTFFVYFSAKEERELKPYEELSDFGKRSRVRAKNYLSRDIYVNNYA